MSEITSSKSPLTPDTRGRASKIGNLFLQANYFLFLGPFKYRVFRSDMRVFEIAETSGEVPEASVEGCELSPYAKGRPFAKYAQMLADGATHEEMHAAMYADGATTVKPIRRLRKPDSGREG